MADFEAGPGKVFVGVGPYLSFGIGGSYKAVFTINGEPFTFGEDPLTGKVIAVPDDQNKSNFDRSIEYGTNSSTTDNSKDLKSLDFGLNFLLGYQLTNGLSINGGYGLGLTNIDADSGIPNNTSSLDIITINFL